MRVFACSPDGIGWAGAYEDLWQEGGRCRLWSEARAAWGPMLCERHDCINGKPYPRDPRHWLFKHQTYCHHGISPFKGVCSKEYCDKTNRQVCSKMLVMHVDYM